MRSIFFITVTAAILFSCKSSKPVLKPVVAPPVLDTVVEKLVGVELNGNWELQKLWGSEGKWNRTPEINIDFDDRTFAGNTGCNSMSGKFTINENYIAINKEILTTKMACTGYNEYSFLSVLLKINRYAVADNVLELSQDDIVLMRFTKK